MYLVGDVVKLKMPSKCRAQKAIITEVVELRIAHPEGPIVMLYKICSAYTGGLYQESIREDEIESFLCHREELHSGWYSD